MTSVNTTSVVHTVTWDRYGEMLEQALGQLLHQDRFKYGEELGVVFPVFGGAFVSGYIARGLTKRVGVEARLFPTSRKYPFTWARPRDFIAADDVLDTGVTLRGIKIQIPQLSSIVTLFAKPQGVKEADELGVKAAYARLIPQEDWVKFPWEEGVPLEYQRVR